MQLYKLSDHMTQVMELMESGADGLEDTLEALNLSFEEKVENCCKAFRNILADRDMCKMEAHRLGERSKALDKQAETLKQYIEVEMRKIGRDEVKSALFKIKMQMSPGSVNVTDEKLIPADYFITPPDPAPSLSKAKLLEDLRKGVEIAGAELLKEKSLKIS